MNTRILIKYLQFFLFIFFLSMLFACKGSKHSSKKDAKPTFLRKRYHDLTARDNSYFNAKMKMLAARQKLSESHKDDYSKVLDLNRFGGVGGGGAVAGDMEEVVKKTSFVVQVHPMSKWVDDAYFLMGQAFYLKNDYSSALGTFQYIATELKTKRPTDKKLSAAEEKKINDAKNSSKSKTSSTGKKGKSSSASNKKKSSSAKKKTSSKSSSVKNKTTKENKETTDAKENKNEKQDGKEEKEKKEKRGFFSFLKHKPIRYEAMVWMVDVYIGEKKYEEALSMIKLLEAEEKFPKRLKPKLSLRNADFYLKQDDYKNAIAPLEESIQLIKKKKPKARYSFILAQCYEATGDNNSALENYKKVLRFRPTYEMEFNAKLKIAKTIEGANPESIAEAKRILKSLLKDEKNEDYLDQVYFALAELSLKQNDEEEAIKYLKFAAEKSTKNNKQKAWAFRKLAEIFYAKEKYPESKYFYDSTLAFLPKEEQEFASISDKRDILAEAVDRIFIIEREDSLQRIAKMTDSERDKFLTSLIKKMKEEEQRKEDSVYHAQQIASQQSTATSSSGGTPASGFYFYNSQAKSKGLQDFQKVWGNRTLEDNWRRKNKQSGVQANFGNTTTTEAKTTRVRYNKEEMKKNLPLSDEKMKASNENLLNAFFELGNIYREKLRNKKKAIETFEEMEKRFPDNQYEPQVYYNLHLLYADVDASRSSYYKAMLDSKHGNSNFAKAVKNPGFVEGTNSRKKQLNDLYETAYKYYLENKFPEVISQKNIADSTYKENELQPKFDLLEALAIGKTSDNESFIKALKQVAEKHKGNEVAVKADEMLKFLQK